MHFKKPLPLLALVFLTACGVKPEQTPPDFSYTSKDKNALVLIGINSAGKPVGNWSGPEHASFMIRLNYEPDGGSFITSSTIGDLWYGKMLEPKDGDLTKNVQYIIRNVRPGRIYITEIEISKPSYPGPKKQTTILSSGSRHTFFDAKAGTVNYIGEIWVDPNAFPAQPRIIRSNDRAKNFLNSHQGITAPLEYSPIKSQPGSTNIR